MASMCPACREAMPILEFAGIEIDRCIACGGIWLDSGELEAILRADGEEPARIIGAIDSAEPLGVSRRRRCPRCRKKLAARRLRDFGVAIDLCPRGDGFWLDRGELQTLTAKKPGAVSAFLKNLFEHELSAKPREV